MSSPIQRQIKQEKPFRSIEEEVFVGLQIVSDRLMAPWSAHLKQAADLMHVQYNVLRILRGAGAAGLTAGEVGERLITRSPDVTRLIDRLAKRGLVVREPDPDDRRAVRIYITDAGREQIASLDPKARAMIRASLGGLTLRKLEALRDSLATVLQSGEDG